GIAAFKTCQMVSDLTKKYEVQVIMTPHATNFIHPLTFETLTGRKCLIDTFDRNFSYEVEHISVAKWADVFVVAPATANVIAKFAHGICDDMLTTTFLACKAPKVIAPAMNTNMYDNPITQQNLQSLRSLGMQIVEPVSGLLACGDTGRGKMADIDIIEEAVEMALHGDKPLAGRRVLVTAGPTQEAMDPVRYITNHSSGKMGYEVARAARNLGAEVTLVSGQCGLKPPYGMETVSVVSAEDMYEAVTSRAADCDYIVMAAAVADYTPAVTAEDKIKKKDDDMSVALKRTHDILKTLGERKSRAQVLCGFAMETQNLLENARKKLEAKNADMIVANNLKVEGAGFAHDTNVATFLLRDGLVENPLQSKETLAYAIWNQLIEIRAQKGID
ncbi:MAG: bifunctional phosphopantothenoylcysteine decarboxylase/phosphopantothenate--cysteine ligase CoaBC, partial [Firmicutes bacterium]|nr:bifunctional phosphopantothenoylcysteine decarboxylase/phosphopantothenate--cysteine ligase CoaBC [Bacillota bacterium]MDY5857304.1 bifunctional phosphopantothenoylcysteine decarboxylase/phosphopantothenate--cysteine ligase CoaBC [Anaerovoracaceae bacterium]